MDEGEEVATDGTQGACKDVGSEREELPGVESAKSYVGMGLAAEIFSLWMGLRKLSQTALRAFQRWDWRRLCEMLFLWFMVDHVLDRRLKVEGHRIVFAYYFRFFREKKI